jgi:hypothetical protein
MGSIGTYLKGQIHSKMLAASLGNLTISRTKIAWFEIMAGRARRLEWIKSRNISQNGGLNSEKSCVRFQTDTMAVSCTGVQYRGGGQYG